MKKGFACDNGKKLFQIRILKLLINNRLRNLCRWQVFHFRAVEVGDSVPCESLDISPYHLFYMPMFYMPTPGRHICIPCSEKEDPEEEKRTADLASAHVIHPFPLSSNRPRGLFSSRESWTSKESGRTVRVPPARAISRAFRSLWSVLRRYFRLRNPRKCRIDWELDIGGTFTDANLVDEATGEVHTAKVPTTPGDPAGDSARRRAASSPSRGSPLPTFRDTRRRVQGRPRNFRKVRAAQQRIPG